MALARKAGKLKHGADAAIEALQKGAPGAIVSADCSQRTLRHTKQACKGQLLQLPLTQHQIQAATGVRFVTAAVLDENFMQLIRLSVNEEA